jgi:hypothetical protein
LTAKWIILDTWRYLQNRQELARNQKKKGCGKRDETEDFLSTDVYKMMLEDEKQKF